jgi:hypothetical protein
MLGQRESETARLEQAVDAFRDALQDVVARWEVLASERSRR